MSRGEIPTKGNFDIFRYRSKKEDAEWDKVRARDAQQFESYMKDMCEKKNHLAEQIIVNDVLYPSVKRAANCLGISYENLRRHWRKLSKSPRTEMDVTITTNKDFTIKKPRNANEG